MRKALLFILGSLVAVNIQAQNPQIQQLVSSVSGDTIWQRISELQDLQRYSRATSTEAQEYIMDKFSSYNFDEVFYQIYDSSMMPNVVAVRYGTKYPDSIYIFGAHYDVYASLAPGADDNGSGTAGILETARVISDLDFEKTLRLACFAGEEQGLLGSEYFIAECLANGENIVCMLNMDMISHSETGNENPEIWVASNDFSDWMFDDLIQVRNTYSPFTSIVDASGYGLADASDHAAFWEQGIPALFLNDCMDMSHANFNPYYHTSNDVLGRSSNNKNLTATTVQLLNAMLAEYAAIADTIAVGYPSFTSIIPLTVYPNPVINQTTLNIPEASENLILCNSMGQCFSPEYIYSDTRIVLNFTKLAPGIYNLTVVAKSGKVYSSKIIKN